MHAYAQTQGVRVRVQISEKGAQTRRRGVDGSDGTNSGAGGADAPRGAIAALRGADRRGARAVLTQRTGTGYDVECRRAG
jgi:hypothetical protein